jgi:hypothetical protein
MATHELKTWPTYWDAVARGEKLFEVRENDRFFQAGDTVELIRLTDDRSSAPYDMELMPPNDNGYRAERPRKLRFKVGPVLQGGQFGIEPRYCVFSLLPFEAGGQADG